jgi:hypothetical protein
MSQTSIQTGWRELFQDAVTGWNGRRNVERLDDACNAIYQRLRRESVTDSLPNEEQGELHDAMHFLHLLGEAAEMEARNHKRRRLPKRPEPSTESELLRRGA